MLLSERLSAVSYIHVDCNMKEQDFGVFDQSYHIKNTTVLLNFRSFVWVICLTRVKFIGQIF